jgi:hypothetical protein
VPTWLAWPARLRRRERRTVSPAGGEAANPAGGDAPGDVLWAVVPPEGVQLVDSRRSRTGEGGQGVLARYSDGTTASVMLNSDGSVRVLFFRGQTMVPAVALPALPADPAGPAHPAGSTDPADPKPAHPTGPESESDAPGAGSPGKAPGGPSGPVPRRFTWTT